MTRLEQSTRRVGEIVNVLAKYGLAGWIKDWPHAWIRRRIRSIDGRPIPPMKLEERVRLALVELGPMFIKFGQLLSTRPDFVGAEMARELAHLQSAVIADPPHVVRATIEDAFGQSVETLFADFEEVPLASASIAQVHRARLRSGEEVVIKVQHTGILRKIMADLDILDSLAELAEKHSLQLRPYQPREVVRQFRRVLVRELDFTVERRNLEEFAAHFADDPTVHFPRPYPRLSTRRVLTMEWLDGTLANDLSTLKAKGADLNEFAWRGATMYVRMIVRDGFYHSDPHPGNLMLLPRGIVGVLDCGKIGRLDAAMREELENLLIAIVNCDSTDLTEILIHFGTSSSTVSRRQLRADISDLVADYTGRSIKELDLGDALSSLLRILRSYNIILAPQMSLLLHTLIELEGTAHQLSPEFSLAEVIQPYYASLARQRVSPTNALDRLLHSLHGWERLAESLPRDLGNVLQRVRDGSLVIRFEHRNLATITNRLVTGLVAAALLVSSSLLWSRNAPPLVAGVSVIGCMGYLLAAFLVLRLLRVVRELGDNSPTE